MSLRAGCLALVAMVMVSATVSLPANAYEFVDGRDRFSSFLDGVSSDSDPGFAVVVAQGDEVLVRRESGLANLETGEAIEPTTRFYAASVAKTMTAATVLLLRNEEALSLADKLTKYFPDAPASLAEVRIYHLLTHMSGLGDHLREEDLPELITNEWVVEYTLAASLLFEAGVDFSYSNSAYVLLSEIIEQVSGVSYAECLRSRIFEPLGMEHTVVLDTPGQGIPKRAVGYSEKDGSFVKSDYSGMVTTGAGGIYSTADDLLLWLRASAKGELLSRRDWELMQTPPVTLSGTRSWLAMGWSEETFGRKTPEYEGLEVVGSIGTLAGFRSTIAYFPSLDLSLVVVSNSGGFPVHTLEVAGCFVTPR